MMAKGKLTDLQFRNLKAGDKERLVSDGGGLYVRIRAKGVGSGVSFRFRSFVGGKQQWITLKASTLAEARRECDVLRERAWEGTDLQLEKKLERERQKQKQLEERAELERQQAELARELARQQALITVQDLFERWAATDLQNRKDGGKEIRRMFEKDVLPVIGHLAVADVRKGHITEITDALLLRGVNRMAKLILSLVRQMFRFAVDRDIIEFDPTASIRKAKIGGKSVERDRVLSDDEIRELCRKLPDANMIPSTECAIWLMLSTCCRVGELSKARWEHVDFAAKTWLIPDEHSKNGKPHIVYLSAFALRQFERLSTYRESDAWLFLDRTKTTHVCDKSISKQINDRQTDRVRSNKSQHKDALRLSGGKWTPHDLRRTGATMMGNLGILPDVIEKCLNHTEQNKMKRVYQRQELKMEQADAWQKLGERLELLAQPDFGNVVFANFGKVNA
jgi:integrase